MRYAGLIKNDVVNGEGITVTVFVQGCPHHCQGCHNANTWGFNDGIEIDENILITNILDAISKNGLQRNLSISGGEPLCKENIPFVKKLIETVKERYPSIKIFCWSGYRYDDLWFQPNSDLLYILNTVNVLITGPYIQSQRDITLKLRGSRNQEIWRRNKDGKLRLDIDCI